MGTAETGMDADDDNPQGPPGARRVSHSLEEKGGLWSKVRPALPAWAASLPLPSPISDWMWLFGMLQH